MRVYDVCVCTFNAFRIRATCGPVMPHAAHVLGNLRGARFYAKVTLTYRWHSGATAGGGE